MDETPRLKKRSVGVRALIVVGDIVLSAFLVWEIIALRAQFISIQNALSGNILSDNREEFITNLQSQLPSAQIWIMAIGGLVITVALMLGVFLCRDHLNKVVTRINAVWLVAWLALGVYWIFIFVALLNAFKAMFG